MSVWMFFKDKFLISLLQDVALFPTLTILETFLYYGRLYGIGRRKVYRRTEELITLLELWSAGSIVDNLRYKQDYDTRYTRFEGSQSLMTGLLKSFIIQSFRVS